MRLQIALLLFCFVINSCVTPQPETPNSNSLTTEGSKPETKSSNNDYYENGNIRIERKRLENGDSLWIFKNEDGSCWEEDFYRDGEIYKKIVYNSDCTKSADFELKDGKRHGYWKSYHENGEEREFGEYKNGLVQSMLYKNEIGETIQLDFGHQRDTFPLKLLFLDLDYKLVKAELKRKNIKFIEDEDIKVAGQDYHFPILSWGENELNFDMLEGSDTVKCLHGKITDNSLPIFYQDKPITFGKDLISICQVLEVSAPHETSNVYVYDLRTKMTYQFEFKNKKLVAIYFQGTNEAY